MRVFKFGGASIKDAKSIQNIVSILGEYENEKLWIVVSAMGKMTNQLELLIQDYFEGKDYLKNLKEVEDFHLKIMEEIFPFRSSTVYTEIYEIFKKLNNKLSTPCSNNYDKEYSAIVGYGELLSTKIVSAYLHQEGIENWWVDIRDYIVTKEGYTEAAVDWISTKAKISKLLLDEDGAFYTNNLKVTQGFLAANAGGETTTLGREGSDFTGAILAWCSDATDLTIWKDVPGLMNADPKKFEDAILLDSISYREALELSFYGASVIHPKTIKPLQNKRIPLYVKSFLNSKDKGTIIQKNEEHDKNTPSFISKSNQILISISPRDFSMVAAKNLSEIYATIAGIGIRINLMQNSALNFSICFDANEMHLSQVQEALSELYIVRYNIQLELLTVRHYTNEILDGLIADRKVIVEQKSRHTARYLLSQN